MSSPEHNFKCKGNNSHKTLLFLELTLVTFTLLPYKKRLNIPLIDPSYPKHAQEYHPTDTTRIISITPQLTSNYAFQELTFKCSNAKYNLLLMYRYDLYSLT